jgi:hypothetical protein
MKYKPSLERRPAARRSHRHVAITGPVQPGRCRLLYLRSSYRRFYEQYRSLLSAMREMSCVESSSRQSNESQEVSRCEMAKHEAFEEVAAARRDLMPSFK